MSIPTGWKRVVFSGDCDEDGACPLCGIDFAECQCPRPTQDEEYEYAEFDGVMCARPKPHLRTVNPAYTAAPIELVFQDQDGNTIPTCEALPYRWANMEDALADWRSGQPFVRTIPPFLP